MCLICLDLQRDRLTSREAYRNFEEMESGLEPDHVAAVYLRIIEKQFLEDEEENYVCTD